MPQRQDARRMVAVKGHPGIYRKGNRYVVVWEFEGRQRKRSLATRNEAVKFKAQTRLGPTVATTRERLSDYARIWMEEYVGRTYKALAPSTRASYRDALTRVVLPYFGDQKRLDAMRPTDLKRFVAHLANTGLAPATVRRYYAPLRALLATAHEDGLIANNPAQGIRVVVKGERPSKPKALTPQQTKAILAQIPPDHTDLVYLLATTGCRIGEALALRWKDVGADAEGKPELAIRESKTEAGKRSLPLTPETARRLIARRSATQFPANDDLIFPTLTGSPIDARNFRRRVFNPARERAGVPWATPHKLRHGMATLAAQHKLSPALIGAHLGHADGGVTALRYYVRPQSIEAPTFVDDALA